MKKILITALLLAGISATAQVKIGDNPTVPHPSGSALLEMESTNKGLLLPRVALTSTTAFAPLTAHVAGMQVYNTATVGDVVPGQYYNDGTKWIKLSGASPENSIVRNVYVDTADPNTATLFSLSPYYPNRDCVAGVTPTTAFTTNASATLSEQTDALYIAQTGCDDNEDYAEYTYWVWDGTNYISFTAPQSTAFNLDPGNIDAGANKLSRIYRDGALRIGNQNGLNSTSGGAITAFHRNSDTNIYQWGFNAQVGGKLTTSRAVHIRGNYNQAVVFTEGTPTITGSIYGNSNFALRNASATDAGTIALLGGYHSLVGHNTATVTGTTTTVVGFESNTTVRGGIITNLSDFYASNTTITGTGAVTNHWGINILGNTKKNYLQGRLGVGVTTPTAKLHVLRTNPTGTISSVGTTVTGVGTNFTTAFVVGEAITVGNVSKTVTAITNATTLTVDSAFTSDLPAGTSYNSINTWLDGGNVSIGSFTPTERLQVFGNTIVKQGSIPNASLGEYRFGQTSTATVNASIGAIRGGGYNGQGSLVFKTSPDDTGAIERMRITDTGNVGINTTTATSKLTVNGNSAITSFTGTTKLGLNIRGAATNGEYNGIDFNPGTVASVGDNPKARIASKLGDTTLGDKTGSYLQFGTTNAWAAGVNNVAMTIDPVGFVGIGTTMPQTKLHVKGLPIYADNVAALAGLGGVGVAEGAFYHTGDGIVRVVF